MQKLVLFLRDADSGPASTRIRDRLGPEAAAALERAFVDDLVARFRSDHDLQLSCWPPGADTEIRERLGSDLRCELQEGADPGARMNAAFVAARDAGAESTVLIGADLPTLSGERVREAFDALTSHDVVLGPARGGGYYLVGLKAPVPDLFERIPWDTYAVLAETLARAWRLELKVAMLAEECAVETPADLEELAKRRVEHPETAHIGPATARILDSLKPRT